MLKMKNDYFIIIASIIFVVGLAFLTYHNPLFTGQVIYEDSPEPNSLNNPEETIAKQEEALTKQDAINAIEQAEQIMQEMKDQGFSLFYVNDTIIEAKRALERADYAAILKGESIENITREQKKHAEEALRLLDWEKLSYNEVLIHTNEIGLRRNQAYEITDLVFLREKDLEQNEQQFNTIGIFKFSGTKKDFSNATILLKEGKLAFKEDRYEDAENLLDQARAEIEYQTEQSATLNSIRGAVLFLFQKYWHIILVLLILLGILIYHLQKKYQIKRFKNKIKKIKSEQQVLMNLMKRTQINRFKKNSISGIVYNIRMKKYQEKHNKNKQQLPVFEARLEKLLKKTPLKKPIKQIKK
jgi:hypothetical protein